MPLARNSSQRRLRAFRQAGRDEKLCCRVGENHRADVTAIQHRAMQPREVALKRNECGADTW